MTKVEQICLAALARPSVERVAFLADACHDDLGLRQEVESLLAQASAADALLEQPAFRVDGAPAGPSGLDIGQRVGPYEIVAPLGAGGMGEVYRGRDTQLGRDVAIKILPRLFAFVPDRLARFEREARVLAALNHPNIAAIYGIESGPAETGHHIRALVMELVEGPTLAARLERGPLPVAEALAVARQIADALEAAHERGIVHRDLKPANIKLGVDGTVKVLDFGLAKRDESGVARPAGDRSRSPRATDGGMTRPGVIVGTAAYMSPEQATGKPIDRRTDIFAFGVVLYEMLTGRPAFEGHSVPEVLARVLERDPDWAALPPAVPPRVHELLRRCLAKDPRHRRRDIGDVRIEIDQALSEPVATAASSADSASRRPTRLAWAAAAMVLATAGAAWMMRDAPADGAEVRLEITMPPTAHPAALAISPDGRTLAFVGASEGRSRLWLRRLSDTTPQVLVGTDNANHPFWSADGRSIGFSVGTELKRIDVDSGAIQTIETGVSLSGGAWLEDDTILATLHPASPMVRIAASGGPPRPVTQINTREVGHRFARMLPDGRHFLCFAGGTDAGIYVGTLGEFTTRKILDADAAAYAATGHVLFVRRGDLFSQPFDVDRLELFGTPTLIAQDIVPGPTGGSAALSVSASGPIVYRSGDAGGARLLRWVDRSGKELDTLRGIEDLGGMGASLSADDRFVAWTRGAGDLWLLELARGVSSRFTSAPSIELVPVWSPDGRRLAYGANTDGDLDLYVKSTSGPGRGERRITAPASQLPTAWSPDGQFVLYVTGISGPPVASQARRSAPTEGGNQIWALPIDGTRPPFMIVDGPGSANNAEFSPDGAWVAFQSNESSRFEIYAQPFPSGDKVLISSAGGVQPRWRPDGKELFYLGPDNRLMAVPVDFSMRGKLPVVGAPVPLFTGQWSLLPQAGNIRNYAVSQEGDRFLVDVLREAVTPATVILNWHPKP